MLCVKSTTTHKIKKNKKTDIKTKNRQNTKHKTQKTKNTNKTKNKKKSSRFFIARQLKKDTV
jgi:hypothetical protein